MTECKYRWTYAAWAEAFSIFERYEAGKAGHIAAEHDRIWAGPDPAIVSVEDRARLDELGWFETSEECFGHFV